METIYNLFNINMASLIKKYSDKNTVQIFFE